MSEGERQTPIGHIILAVETIFALLPYIPGSLMSNPFTKPVENW